MATYTLLVTLRSGAQPWNTTEFADDEMVIADAKGGLGEDVVSVAIARGSRLADTEWLGAWDWNDGEPKWTPDSET